MTEHLEMGYLLTDNVPLEKRDLPSDPTEAFMYVGSKETSKQRRERRKSSQLRRRAQQLLETPSPRVM